MVGNKERKDSVIRADASYHVEKSIFGYSGYTEKSERQWAEPIRDNRYAQKYLCIHLKAGVSSNGNRTVAARREKGD